MKKITLNELLEGTVKENSLSCGPSHSCGGGGR